MGLHRAGTLERLGHEPGKILRQNPLEPELNFQADFLTNFNDRFFLKAYAVAHVSSQVLERVDLTTLARSDVFIVAY